MVAKDYRELRVYQTAFKSAVQMHNLTKLFPAEEKYSLVDEIRRASRSTCANIGEAWRKRHYRNNFISKLSDADSETAEVLIWLDFALEFGYMSKANYDVLFSKYTIISRQLALMMTNADQWVMRPNDK